jgi:putative phosphoesterase
MQRQRFDSLDLSLRWISMKIVVMSDTHLNRLTAEFQSICERYCDDADLVIHLGDWVTAAIVAFMEQYPLEAVAGNMDNSIIHDRFPPKKVIRVGRFRIGITHGWGSGSDLKNKLSQEFSNVDAIFFGHTHQPFQCEENRILWFNPGSVFFGRGNLQRTLGILHVDDSLRAEIIPL